MLSLETLAYPTGIASLLLFVMLFLYWYGTRGFADLKKLNVSGPKPLPFLGSFLHVRKYNGLHPLFVDYVKKYGKVFAICLGTRPTLVITEPELAKQILTRDFHKFRNHFIVQRTGFPLNLLEAKDETRKRIRNILTPRLAREKWSWWCHWSRNAVTRSWRNLKMLLIHVSNEFFSVCSKRIEFSHR